MVLIVLQLFSPLSVVHAFLVGTSTTKSIFGGRGRLSHPETAIIDATTTTATTRTRRSSRLYYMYNDTLADNQSSSNNNNNHPRQEQQQQQQRIRETPTTTTILPILGPLLDRAKPLLVGQSMVLTPPITPLQWYTIQTCVDVHNNKAIAAMSEAVGGSESINDDNNPSSSFSSSYVTIDESPIVAVLHQGSTEYATLAAIVGISSLMDRTSSGSSSSGDGDHDYNSNKNDKSVHGNDGDDEDNDFHQTINRLALEYMNTKYYNDKSQVRLVGIGRVKLSHIMTMTKKDTEDTVAVNNDYDDYEEENVEEQEQDIIPEPILVAQRVQLLWDNSTIDGEYTKAASPVHSINKVSTQVSKIKYLHDQRQRLTRNLQMAQLRLDIASQRWQDHDGIGSIGVGSVGKSVGESSQSISTVIDNDHEGNGFQFLDTVSSSSLSSSSSSSTTTTTALMETDDILSSDVDHHDHNNSNYYYDNTNNVSLTTTMPSEGALRCLTELDNYGLGYTRSAMVDLDSMTDVFVQDILRPYFSPQLLATEEFYYEALSWVALSSLDMYCTVDELEDAMFHTTRTTERLDIIYRAQLRHKQDLLELSKRKEQELLDCGEECTDIF